MASTDTRPGPGRPREFDLDTAIGDAVGIFQTGGYAGTSMEDLMAGTGLSRGSLYKAFTDKHTLFLAALDRYAADNTGALQAHLNGPDALAGIRAALLAVAHAATREFGRRGCLVVNTATEMTTKDADIHRKIAATWTTMQRLLETAIRTGQATGQITSRESPAALARFLLCTIEGMGVLGKTGRRATEMNQIVDIAMRALQ